MKVLDRISEYIITYKVEPLTISTVLKQDK